MPLSTTQFAAGDVNYIAKLNAFATAVYFRTLNVKDYGAVGDGTTDDTAAIQEAINAANTMATTSQQRSRTTVWLPDGNYKITAQLDVKANVNIKCDGFITNGLASTTAFCMLFRAYSACERLVLFGNGKGGVQFGENGLYCDLQIGDVRMLNMGESTNQFACRFVGFNHTVESIDIDGGNVGLDIGDGSTYGCSDLRIDKVLLYTCSTGLRIGVGSEHVWIGHLAIDSNNYMGMQIDSCNDVSLPDYYVFWNEAESPPAFDSGYAIKIGQYSAAGGVSGLYMKGRVINTAKTDNSVGTAMYVANIKHSKIDLHASNTTVGTGNSHRIVQALEYGSGIDGSLVITGEFHSTLTPYTGTPVGRLSYWNGTRLVNSTMEGSYTATATGMTTSPTGTVRYSMDGNMVTLEMVAISGTSNATTFTLTGAPALIRPSADRTFPARVQDNTGATVMAMGVMNSSGTITLSANANGGAFTASGTKSVQPLSVSYIL